MSNYLPNIKEARDDNRVALKTISRVEFTNNGGIALLTSRRAAKYYSDYAAEMHHYKKQVHTRTIRITAEREMLWCDYDNDNILEYYKRLPRQYRFNTIRTMSYEKLADTFRIIKLSRHTVYD